MSSADKFLGNTTINQDFYYDYPPPPINLSTDPNIENSRSNGHVTAARGVAQERRKQENEQFRRLSALLPISRQISDQHLDKASIVRLAKTVIRLNRAVAEWKSNKYIGGPIVESNVINLIDGFLCIFAPNFEFLYVSETISQHLGLSQIELCGNSLWNYVHADDLPNLRSALSQLQYVSDILLNFRMRSTLTKRRSRETPNCTAGYKVVTLEINNAPNWSLILAFCQPHSSKISNGIRILSNSLVISTDDALQIVYTDMQNSNVAKNLISQSFYKFVHPEDLHLIVEMHKRLQVVGSYHSKFLRLTIDNQLIDAEIMAIRYNSTIKMNKSEKSGSQNRITLLIMQ